MLSHRNGFACLALALAAGLAACSGSQSLPPAGPSIMARGAPGTFQLARSQPPDYMQMAYLMTDGSVVAQGYSNSASWYRYVPDSSGSYSNGTWTQVASLYAGYAPSARSRRTS